jgi:hypothetical protein
MTGARWSSQAPSTSASPTSTICCPKVSCARVQADRRRVTMPAHPKLRRGSACMQACMQVSSDIAGGGEPTSRPATAAMQRARLTCRLITNDTVTVPAPGALPCRAWAVATARNMSRRGGARGW